MSANGKLTSAELSSVGGMLLANSTARAWEAMVEAAKADGISLAIVRPAGAYRSYFVQGDMKKNPAAYNLSTASVVAIAGPGYSTHGLGNAVDVSSCTGARLTWMLKNGPRFGFTRTFGARDPNHFGHDGTVPNLTPASNGKPITVPEDELSNEQLEEVRSDLATRLDGRVIPLLQQILQQLSNEDATDDAVAEDVRTQIVGRLDRIVIPGIQGVAAGQVALTDAQVSKIVEAAKSGAESGVKALSFVVSAQ